MLYSMVSHGSSYPLWLQQAHHFSTNRSSLLRWAIWKIPKRKILKNPYIIAYSLLSLSNYSSWGQGVLSWWAGTIADQSICCDQSYQEISWRNCAIEGSTYCWQCLDKTEVTSSALQIVNQMIEYTYPKPNLYYFPNTQTKIRSYIINQIWEGSSSNRTSWTRICSASALNRYWHISFYLPARNVSHHIPLSLDSPDF